MVPNPVKMRPQCFYSAVMENLKVEYCISFRHLINSGGSKGIRSHDLCDAGAMHYKLSYEATQLGAGQFVGLRCSREGVDE